MTIPMNKLHYKDTKTRPMQADVSPCSYGCLQEPRAPNHEFRSNRTREKPSCTVTAHKDKSNRRTSDADSRTGIPWRFLRGPERMREKKKTVNRRGDGEGGKKNAKNESRKKKKKPGRGWHFNRLSGVAFHSIATWQHYWRGRPRIIVHLRA